MIANLYLGIVDFWFIKHTRYRDMMWIRYADDGVLVSRNPTNRIRNRLRGVLKKIGLQIHPEKTHEVDLDQDGATMEYLGFQILRRRARTTQNTALVRAPSPKAQKRIRIRLRDTIRRDGWRKPHEMVARVNQQVRGWVMYFSHSNRKSPFRSLAKFVQKRFRAHLARRKRVAGRGTRRFSDQWLSTKLGLLDAYVLYAQLRLPKPRDSEETHGKARCVSSARRV